MNVNTKDYWDNRFASGDWEGKRGRTQTQQFADTQVKYLNIEPGFSGTILDFGCGLGDAMPVYRSKFPLAKLIGVDISAKGIEICRQKFGTIAEFIHGDHSTVPDVDVIIASNVFEHLSDDIDIAKSLINKCDDLYITVPYKEIIVPNAEHINSYDIDSFKSIGKYDWSIFACKGWSEYGLDLYYNIYLKNLLRPFMGRLLVKRMMQIMFHFRSDITIR